MTPQRLIFGIGAIVGTYLLVFVSLMVVMSFMASGTPEIDARNASLAMMNLIAKLVLAGAMGFVAGLAFIKNGWWIAALTLTVVIASATLLFSRSFLLAIFATDSLVFDAVYVIVASIGGKFGEYIALHRMAKKP